MKENSDHLHVRNSQRTYVRFTENGGDVVGRLYILQGWSSVTVGKALAYHVAHQV